MSPRPRLSGRRLKRWLQNKTDLAALLQLSQTDRDRLDWQAHRALADGQINDAERLFDLRAQLWPRDQGPAKLGQGVCRQASGDLDGAERAYRECLDVEPVNVFALVNLAEVHLLRQRPSDAETHLTAALTALGPNGGPTDLRHRIQRLNELIMTCKDAP
jgi:Flp pilus assembly protein TadD